MPNKTKELLVINTRVKMMKISEQNIIVKMLHQENRRQLAANIFGKKKKLKPKTYLPLH